MESPLYPAGCDPNRRVYPEHVPRLMNYRRFRHEFEVGKERPHRITLEAGLLGTTRCVWQLRAVRSPSLTDRWWSNSHCCARFDRMGVESCTNFQTHGT